MCPEIFDVRAESSDRDEDAASEDLKLLNNHEKGVPCLSTGAIIP